MKNLYVTIVGLVFAAVSLSAQNLCYSLVIKGETKEEKRLLHVRDSAVFYYLKNYNSIDSANYKITFMGDYGTIPFTYDKVKATADKKPTDEYEIQGI